jgi:hypothetical protein
MRTLFKITLLFILTFGLSCEKSGLFIKCADCLQEEPTKTELVVKLDIANFGAFVKIDVYEGNLEDNFLFKSVDGSGTEYYVQVTINKKYTLTATYFIDGNYYKVLDSTTPKVRYTSSPCADRCYFVYDKTVDLRMKYNK